MRNRILYALLASVVLFLLAVLFMSVFEIYPKGSEGYYSLEARSNSFLALERWLVAEHIPVMRLRRVSFETLMAQQGGKVIVLETGTMVWPLDAGDRLRAWAASGGHILIALDHAVDPETEKGLSSLLSGLGLSVLEDDDEEEAEEVSGTEVSNAQEIDWDESLYFDCTPGKPGPLHADKIELLPASGGQTRFARFSFAEGSISVLGVPYFMYSRLLKSGGNASLAWRLSGALPAARAGVVFVTGGNPEPSLFGRIANRGHPLPLLISLGLLLGVSLWMVLPRIGRPASVPRRPGKPLRERFNAEGRFFLHYGKLGVYRASYVKALRTRLRRATGMDVPEDEKLAVILAEKTGLGSKEIHNAICGTGKTSAAEFRKSVEMFDKIMEKL